MTDDLERFSRLLAPILEITQLHSRVLSVLVVLPSDVIQDFIGDPSFRIALDDFVPGRGRKVWMPIPDQTRSRCVVLKERLAVCSEEFARYIIAHELAHAFLNNGGWEGITDPELAADAMAANWGFPRPDSWR